MLSSINAKVDQGCASEEDIINRKDSTIVMGELYRMEAIDLAQKANIKWAIEDWIEDLDHVKTEFLTYFRNRFQQSIGISPSLDVTILIIFL
ncbi:hypothetical protein Tco_1341382 [Tanacetum coccineum]